MKYFLESPDPSASHGLPEGFAAHLVADCKDWLGYVKKCEPLEVCISRFEGGESRIRDKLYAVNDSF
jgi:hypothetical protein